MRRCGIGLVVAALLMSTSSRPHLSSAGLHQPLAVRVLRHVALHDDRLGARRLAGRRDLLAAGLVGRVVHHHVAAARRQDLRALRADAFVRARAGDDGGLAFDFQHTSCAQKSSSIRPRGSEEWRVDFGYRCAPSRPPWRSAQAGRLAILAQHRLDLLAGARVDLEAALLASSRKAWSFMVASKARRSACDAIGRHIGRREPRPSGLERSTHGTPGYRAAPRSWRTRTWSAP